MYRTMGTSFQGRRHYDNAWYHLIHFLHYRNSSCPLFRFIFFNVMYRLSVNDSRVFSCLLCALTVVFNNKFLQFFFIWSACVSTILPSLLICLTLSHAVLYVTLKYISQLIQEYCHLNSIVSNPPGTSLFKYFIF